MASICKEPVGRKRIQFIAADRKRRGIRLGKVSMRIAEAVKVRIEHIVASQITGHALDDETARWVAGLDVSFSDKLAAAGLIAPRMASTLAAFIDGYIQSRGDVKSSTVLVYGHTRRYLVKYFGSEKQLRDITPGDADEWRLWLINKLNLADNTVRRRCGIAKQFFKAALRKRLITLNPFTELPTLVRQNNERMYFVTREEAESIIDECPDSEWRLIFALCRYGGIRCPSELLTLRWSDIDWDRGRIVVHSPKTEHYPGGESRLIPIFPEIFPYLRTMFEEAEPGTEYVINRYRDTNVNLRTQLTRIIKRAGLTPWAKPFQNLRSTRETELAEDFPLHVVCAWIGNSQPVAMKHYLQVTDEHFEKAVQNPVQQRLVSSRIEPQPKTPVTQEYQFNESVREFATTCESTNSTEMGPEGLEPPTKRL